MSVFKRKTDYFIAAFLVGALFMLYTCESAEADWAVEYFHDSNAGSTAFNQGWDRVCGRYVFDSDASFAVCPLVAVGGDTRSTSFEIGIADKLFERLEWQITLSQFDDTVDGGFTIRRLVGDGPFQMAIGGSYWVDHSPGSNSNFTFNLGMRYTFGGDK